MINAAKARKMSLVNEKAKNYLDQLEKEINLNIDTGVYSARIYHDIDPETYENVCIKEGLFQMLEELGYKVNFKFSQKCPFNISEEHWDNKNGVLEVSWKE